MINTVVLTGRLTKDSELRYTPSGVAVCNFTLAVDRNFKNAQGERETDFIPCVAYRQTAEFAANYTERGKLVGVDGRIQVRSYTGQDGQKRWVTEVIVNNVTLLSPKNSSGEQPQGQPPSGQPAQPGPPGMPPPPSGYGAPPQGGQGYPPNSSSYGHPAPPNIMEDCPF